MGEMDRREGGGTIGRVSRKPGKSESWRRRESARECALGEGQVRIDSCAAAQNSVGEKGAAADDVPDDVSGTKEGDCLGECGGDIVVWCSKQQRRVSWSKWCLVTDVNRMCIGR